MNNKKRNIIITTILAVVVVGILCIILAVTFLRNIISEYNEYTDISAFSGRDSLVNREEYTDYFSHLLGFPDNMEDISVEEYLYREQICGLDMTYYIFLRYSMSEDKYVSEKERLANIFMSYKGKEQFPIYIDDVYEYPVYVMSYEMRRTHEYVMLNDDAQEIVCVYVQLADCADGKIPQEYVLDFSKIVDRVPDRYNMYYFETESGSSVMPNLEGTEVEKGRLLYTD